MSEIQIYIRATITILGLAYPILLQVIARLDEKYDSIQIVELFDYEKSKKWFRNILIISLLAIFIWTFKFEPLLKLTGRWNYLLENSANILVLASATALVFSFFFFVEKILIYYTPVKFINYLIRKYDKDIGDLRYFNALGDVFLMSIQKQNHNISETISRFFYDAFNKARKHSSKPVIYPDAYYSLVFKTIEELAVLKSKKNTALEYSTAGGVWLLGELQGFEISETTYIWLWRNMLLAVKYEQDDMLLFHWETAHQFFVFSLTKISPDYDTETHTIKNQRAIDKRDQERSKFLEFHYALGGLLLYTQRYKCISRIFNYTTSEPPDYVLLPKRMDDIFKSYVAFQDIFDTTWISRKYWFPDQEGINSDRVIRKWVSSYLAVLFLRQYSIVPHLITMQPLALPNLPGSQGEKRTWISAMGFFKKLVTEAMINSSLIETLRLAFITKEWCKENKKLHPYDFIDKLKKSLEEQYKKEATILTISEDKRMEFYNSTVKIIEETYEKYTPINNSVEILTEYNHWFVNGMTMVQSKDAFSEKPEVHHMDFDSFLATVISGNIKEGIAETFTYCKTKTYIIKPEDVFSAIDQLNIDENYLIVSFGVYIPFYVESLKIKGLSLTDYKGIVLVELPHSQSVYQSLFILKKSDLPSIISKDIETPEREKYSLEKKSETHNIYASVLDLNEVSEEIRIESSQGKKEEELRKSVLLYIAQQTEIRWKKGISLVQIIVYSEYEQKGLPNKVIDVKELTKS